MCLYFRSLISSISPLNLIELKFSYLSLKYVIFYLIKNGGTFLGAVERKSIVDASDLKRRWKFFHCLSRLRTVFRNLWQHTFESFYLFCFLSDINECTEGLVSCGRDRRCKNTYGDFMCICHHGYRFNYVNGKLKCVGKYLFLQK